MSRTMTKDEAAAKVRRIYGKAHSKGMGEKDAGDLTTAVDIILAELTLQQRDAMFNGVLMLNWWKRTHASRRNGAKLRIGEERTAKAKVV